MPKLKEDKFIVSTRLCNAPSQDGLRGVRDPTRLTLRHQFGSHDYAMRTCEPVVSYIWPMSVCLAVDEVSWKEGVTA